MERFQSSIEVDAPSSVCYQKWHRFDEFPHFMKNVAQVSLVSGKLWHWVVNGPLGTTVEWDALIDGDETNRVISWHSVPGSEVKIEGAVRFDESAPDRTMVSCTIQYDPPAHKLGEAVANLFSNPHKMVEEDLQNFKHLVEGTNVPAEKVHVGKILQPDPFVVPQAGISQTLVADALDDEDYEAVYALEDKLPEIGTSAEIDAADIAEIQSLRDEEEPYLAMEGALYSEDLIDMRADVQGMDDSDVFTNSMDISEEDLENFTQDMDEEIDIGLGPRESIEDYQAQSERDTAVNPGNIKGNSA